MTHGSLFAGIGGFDLGFERVGIKTVWQVEINPFCRKVLERHFPEAERFEDVRSVTGLPWVDVVTGGFPCQDVSHAGLRAGIEGSRSGLWAEMFRIICHLRPNFVVVENVAALLQRGMERVLGDLARGGFDAEWRVLSACRFGASHTRARVFIVAYPNSFGLQGCIFRGIEGQSIQSIVSSVCNPSARRWKEQLPTPRFCRGIDGIPNKMDRISGLGNAVVPQIAEWIGRRILEANQEQVPGVGK